MRDENEGRKMQVGKGEWDNNTRYVQYQISYKRHQYEGNGRSSPSALITPSHPLFSTSPGLLYIPTYHDLDNRCFSPRTRIFKLHQISSLLIFLPCTSLTNLFFIFDAEQVVSYQPSPFFFCLNPPQKSSLRSFVVVVWYRKTCPLKFCFQIQRSDSPMSKLSHRTSFEVGKRMTFLLR